MPVYGYPMTTNSKLTIERFFTGALKPGMAFLGEDDMLILDRVQWFVNHF